MLRVTVSTRDVLVDAPAADQDEAVAEVVDLIRQVRPLTHRRESFVKRVTAAVRAGIPVQLIDSELGVKVCVEQAPT